MARALSEAREIIEERSGGWEEGRRMEVIIVEFRRVWRSCEWSSGEGRSVERGEGGHVVERRFEKWRSIECKSHEQMLIN